MYADEFNIDLAQAINELETLCNQGSLEKKLINNESFYIKATQLSFYLKKHKNSTGKRKLKQKDEPHFFFFI